MPRSSASVCHSAARRLVRLEISPRSVARRWIKIDKDGNRSRSHVWRRRPTSRSLSSFAYKAGRVALVLVPSFREWICRSYTTHVKISCDLSSFDMLRSSIPLSSRRKIAYYNIASLCLSAISCLGTLLYSTILQYSMAKRRELPPLIENYQHDPHHQSPDPFSPFPPTIRLVHVSATRPHLAPDQIPRKKG